MKIILASDKFKGTLSSQQVIKIEKEAILSVHPTAELLEFPLADGGDGTLEVLLQALKGEKKEVQVQDPLGRSITASIGIINQLAIVEMATASGLSLLDIAERNPLKTSTFGTGQLILAALDNNATEIIVGVGGSATIDGGIGMASALGYRFFDKNHNELVNPCGETLTKISYIDNTYIDKRVLNAKIWVASDVTNPLLGPTGAVAVYGKQKGATASMQLILESGLANLSKVLQTQNYITSSDAAGDGAGGGIALGLRSFCKATIASGAESMFRLTNLEQHLKNCDYLITGEGLSDNQTAYGKLCYQLAELCKKHNVKCILLSGAITNTDLTSFHKSYYTFPPNTPFDVIKEKAAEALHQSAIKLAQNL